MKSSIFPIERKNMQRHVLMVNFEKSEAWWEEEPCIIDSHFNLYLHS